MTINRKERKERKEAGGGRKFNPKSLLFPFQRRFMEDESRFKIGAMARQTGKSHITSGEAVEDCIIDPGTKWVCLSAGERQALEWLDKTKDWTEAFRLPIESYAEDRSSAEALLKAAEIRYANGSRIIAIPANPSTARGYSANIVLDEFAYHENPVAIWAAMFPSVSNPLAGTFLTRVKAAIAGKPTDFRRNLKVRVVSTFNGRDNKFFDLWDHAKQNGYSAHLVTIHDAVKDGLPLNIEELKAGLDDPDLWAQEYECVPCDTSATLLPYDLIALAESADALEFCDPAFFATRGNPCYCGIDFGRQHDPTVCWTFEAVGGILWTREVLVLKNTDTPDQVEILKSRVRRAARVCLDYTGPGVGLGDYLAKEFIEFDPAKHSFGKVELCTFTLEFKRDIFPKLRRAFEAPTRVRVPVSRAIREDLHAMQQVVTNGQYNYWAPRTKEGHSDRCTAAALGLRAAGSGPAGIMDPSVIRLPERLLSRAILRPRRLVEV